MMNHLKFKTLLMGLLLTVTALGQGAKKPTVMIVPDDDWCIANGFSMTFDNQGYQQEIPNYLAALQNSSELNQVITKIEGLMTDRGFPLKNLKASLDILNAQSAEDAMMMSKEGGILNESPIDALKKTAKADIWMKLSWDLNQVGPKKSVNFRLSGIDAYTGKSKASVSGTGPSMFAAETTVLLEGAVLSHIDQFNIQLQEHFNDMMLNGREISLRIMTWDTFEYDLEEEFTGPYGTDELGFIIEDWVADNVVEGTSANTVDATESMMLFEEVRIPLFNERGRAIDARRWARGLAKYMEQNFGFVSKTSTRGLGQSQLTLGAK